MCNKAVEAGQWLLDGVPDWFATQGRLKIWYDEDDYCNDNKLIKWYEGYKRRRAQKAQIKKELMPIAWHPSRQWGWCVSEDEIRDTEALWAYTQAFLDLVAGYKNFLTQKELQIKMYSVMLFSFNAVQLCVVTINEKPWTLGKEI